MLISPTPNRKTAPRATKPDRDLVVQKRACRSSARSSNGTSLLLSLARIAKVPRVTATMSSPVDPPARAKPTTRAPHTARRRDVPVRRGRRLKRHSWGDHVRDDSARRENARIHSNGLGFRFPAPSGRVSFGYRVRHKARLRCLSARSRRPGRRRGRRRRRWSCSCTRRRGSRRLGRCRD